MSIFDKRGMPPRAFFVFACAFLIAFLVATNVARFMIDKASPFVIFGHRAQNEHITVVFNGRGLIKFSNGVEIRGIKLLPFDILFGCATGLVGAALWWALIKVGIRGAHIFSPVFANEISELYREILGTFRVQPK